ncbi:NAD(P)-binding protein [Armillaria mellea]|nr:NAD(P)-binding protein [Armillaria mellea]
MILFNTAFEMAPKVYLVTGANRRIGISLVNELAVKNSDISIFAGVRNLSTSSSLEELSKKYPRKISIVKYISADEQGNKALVKDIETKHWSSRCIVTYMGSALRTRASQLRDHLDVNATGILVLFKSVHSLLTASTSSPRFIFIPSAAASLTAFISLPAGYLCYGASKVTGN